MSREQGLIYSTGVSLKRLRSMALDLDTEVDAVELSVQQGD